MDQLGVPPSIHASFSGTAATFTKALRSGPADPRRFGQRLYRARHTYESYVHPLTILSTLPSAGVGAVLALKLCGLEFSVIALIGMILLIGIVKKNAIMMIDFALQAERGGMDAREAIRNACLLRFRPILMTTLAAAVGALPLALGMGEGAELRQPLDFHRRRIAREPAAHALHNARRLHLSRRFQRLAQEAAHKYARDMARPDFSPPAVH